MPSVSNSSTVTVTVTTTGALAQLPASTGTSHRYLGSWVIGPIGIFGVLLIGTARRRKSRTLAAGAMVVMLMILIGCSGTQKPAPSSTPSGTYNFNVIAQSGALQHSTQLTLVVRNGQ
jgi:hypothetical protein